MKPAWEQSLNDEFGIRLVPSHELPGLLEANDVLWTTRCCASKLRRGGLPRAMYRSHITDHFFRFADLWRLSYAIVSDKYGLHMHDERLPYYNLHPTKLMDADKRRLGLLIEEKSLAWGAKRLVFYNNSPLMSRPYFEILSRVTRVDILYATRLYFGEKRHGK